MFSNAELNISLGRKCVVGGEELGDVLADEEGLKLRLGGESESGAVDVVEDWRRRKGKLKLGRR